MTLLEVDSLVKRFSLRSSAKRSVGGLLSYARSHSELHAVDDVSFKVEVGETLGVVGESGSGKSTLLRLLSRLMDPTSGKILFGEQRIDGIPAARFAASRSRKDIQMVFQDHTGSLNPHFKIFDIIADPLRRMGSIPSAAGLRCQVEKVADRVSLRRQLLDRYPHQLSGGERARVGIARAIIIEPQLLLLDEPTSALDVSVQSVILHLLDDLRRERGLTYIFVSHDLNVVQLLCDRVLVMYSGRVVEQGEAQAVLKRPRHPYTHALVSSIPGVEQASAAKSVLSDREPVGAINPAPNVCRYSSHCPRATERCVSEMPALRPIGGGHFVACHFPHD